MHRAVEVHRSAVGVDHRDPRRRPDGIVYDRGVEVGHLVAGSDETFGDALDSVVIADLETVVGQSFRSLEQVEYVVSEAPAQPETSACQSVLDRQADGASVEVRGIVDVRNGEAYVRDGRSREGACGAALLQSDASGCVHVRNPPFGAMCGWCGGHVSLSSVADDRSSTGARLLSVWVGPPGPEAFRLE